MTKASPEKMKCDKFAASTESGSGIDGEDAGSHASRKQRIDSVVGRGSGPRANADTDATMKRVEPMVGEESVADAALPRPTRKYGSSGDIAIEKRRVSTADNIMRKASMDGEGGSKPRPCRTATEVGLEKPEVVTAYRASLRASSKPGAVAVSAAAAGGGTASSEKRLEMCPDQDPENESIDVDSKSKPHTTTASIALSEVELERNVQFARPGAFRIDGSRSNLQETDHFTYYEESTQQVPMEPQLPVDSAPIVAHLVPDDEERPADHFGDKESDSNVIVAVAKKDSLFKLLRHDRRSQAIVALVVIAVIALGVGLGVSLSRNSDNQKQFVLDEEYIQTGENIDGPAKSFELGSGEDSKFGSAVSIDGNGTRIVIGAPQFTDADGNPLVGLVQVFEEVNGNWTQMTPSILGNATGGRTGSSVAISLDGNTIAVGSPGAGKGQVTMYRLTSGTWQQLGNTLSGETEGDRLGASVSISEDGQRVAVGVPGRSGSGNLVAKVFEYTSFGWSQLGNDLQGSFGGTTIAMSADGCCVALGSLSTAENDLLAAVPVYEFSKSSNWTLRGDEILLRGAKGSYETGWSTSLSGDGKTLAIGSSVENAQQVGEEYDLFVQTYTFAEETGWTQLGETLHDKTGSHLISYATSLSATGLVLAIGDPGGLARGVNSGHTHVLRWQDGEWFHISRELEGTDAADQFGMAVSMNMNGTRVGVGAPNSRATGTEVGRVQIYELTDVQ